MLSGPDVLWREVPRRGIRDVILTGGGADEDRAPQMLRISTYFGCDVWFVPGFPDYGAFEHAGRRTAVGDHLWGFPCLRLGGNPMQRPSWAVKRAFCRVRAAAARPGAASARSRCGSRAVPG